MTQQVVIAGAGHGAGQVVATLKQKKFDGRIVLIGDEPYLPYQRPPLSKKFLAGEMPPERLYFKPTSFYADDQIDARLATRVESINREDNSVYCSDGTTVHYDKLVLATGSRVRRVQVPGSDLDGIHYLRSIADVERIRADLEDARRLVIVGAGYIGLEVAAVARQLGHDVTVVEMAERVMSRVVSPEISTFYEQQHTQHGVRLLLSTGLESFHGTERVQSVACSDGQVLPADLVVVGVGIVPNTELAESAGLDTNDGIVVNDRCQTSAADIYAIGDCTRHPSATYRRSLRLESVHNALEQAKTAASNICGVASHYAQVPWFWSDQYDLKLQIAGLSQGYDDVVLRGSSSEGSFSCLYLRDGQLIAIDAVNAPRDFMQSKPLIEKRARIDKALLADSSVMLKDML